MINSNNNLKLEKNNKSNNIQKNELIENKKEDIQDSRNKNLKNENFKVKTNIYSVNKKIDNLNN